MRREDRTARLRPPGIRSPPFLRAHPLPPAIDGRFLRYPAYKLGRPRAFRLEGRLAIVAGQPRAFNRRLWLEAVKKLGLPGLRPHDIRHSVLTAVGHRQDASLLSISALGGWKSPAMAATYLHSDSTALRAVESRKAARK